MGDFVEDFEFVDRMLREKKEKAAEDQKRKKFVIKGGKKLGGADGQDFASVIDAIKSGSHGVNTIADK